MNVQVGNRPDVLAWPGRDLFFAAQDPEVGVLNDNGDDGSGCASQSYMNWSSTVIRPPLSTPRLTRMEPAGNGGGGAGVETA
ncbi:hypothetical protein ACFW9I_32895 [[Kitasatospora] papulosa]|uniref:hypothetical protein n=1 Tax=[Kitasatospora] papulosa TaxID=1464011 RepID=UPI0036AD13C2